MKAFQQHFQLSLEYNNTKHKRPSAYFMGYTAYRFKSTVLSAWETWMYFPVNPPCFYHADISKLIRRVILSSYRKQIHLSPFISREHENTESDCINTQVNVGLYA